MRFMVMHKVDDDMEAGRPPRPGIVENMGALVQDGLTSGVFLDGAGLHRSAVRVRLRAAAGECTVTKGPYAGDNELVASFLMLKARSMDDAVGYARRIAQVLGDVEIEIGPVVEAWDLGLIAKPEGLDIGRFLLLIKGDRRTESGAALPAVQRAALTRLTEELDRAGVLLAVDSLTPTSAGTRLPSARKGQRRTWVDGPFSESKELIAGYSIIDLPAREDAIEWADRYAAILGDNEVDIRPLADG